MQFFNFLWRPNSRAKALVEMGVRVGYIIAMVHVSKHARLLSSDAIAFLAVNSISEHIAELTKLYNLWPELRAMQKDETMAYGLHDASPEVLRAIGRQNFANQFRPEEKKL